jgi:hypothetical protein
VNGLLLNHLFTFYHETTFDRYAKINPRDVIHNTEKVFICSITLDDVTISDKVFPKHVRWEHLYIIRYNIILSNKPITSLFHDVKSAP